MLHPFVTALILVLLKIVCLLIAIAYYTIAERKIMAAIQRRRGPNVVGFWGLLQPLADGLKLLSKEMITPSHANSKIFVIAPIVILTLGLLTWSIIPFSCLDYSETTKLKAISKTLYLDINETQASQYLRAFEHRIEVENASVEPKTAVFGGLLGVGLTAGTIAYVYANSPNRIIPPMQARGLVKSLGEDLNPYQLAAAKALIKEPNLDLVLEKVAARNKMINEQMQYGEGMVSKNDQILIDGKPLELKAIKSENPQDNPRSHVDTTKAEEKYESFVEGAKVMHDKIGKYIMKNVMNGRPSEENLNDEALELNNDIENSAELKVRMLGEADNNVKLADAQQLLELEIARYVIFGSTALVIIAAVNLAPVVSRLVTRTFYPSSGKDSTFLHEIHDMGHTVRYFSDNSSVNENYIMIDGFLKPYYCIVDPLWKGVSANGSELRRAINPTDGRTITFMNAKGLSESALEELKKTRIPVTSEKSFAGSEGREDASLSFSLLTERDEIANVSYGLLFILALSSLTVYGLIIAGWASNSKYAFLGALRSAAQMISYEVAISLVILPIITMSGALNLLKIIFAQIMTLWFFFPLSPISLIFFISMIAETNRTPFDLPEAEAELVAGYNVEYSSIIFAMFFLAEYSNMILMSLLKIILFFGGWESGAISTLLPSAGLSVKGLVFCFLFVLIRATFPRYRYDQLMDIGWKIFLPIATGFLVYSTGLKVAALAVPLTIEIQNLVYNERLYTYQYDK